MMSRDEILAKLTDYLEEMFEIPREKIMPEAHLFEDLGLDSIDAVDLTVKLQDLTGRRIHPEQFKEIRTVRDIVGAVEKLLAVNETAGQ
ncbi:MAG TPA: acyl carrier protein [Magnetospirillaceae bacterium]